MFSNQPQDLLSPQALRQAYDDLFQAHWLVDERNALVHWLTSQLNPTPQTNWLDIACGNGEFGKLLEATHNINFYGLDFSFYAAHNGAHPQLFVGDGLQLPFADNHFDYVSNIGSLEHFWDMSQGLQEMARVLKPNGTAYILLPNAFSLTWNFLSVYKTGDMSDEDGQPLQRFATRRGWEQLLNQNGFTVQQTIRYEQVTPTSLKGWWHMVSHPKQGFLLAISPFVPLNLCRCFVFVCGLK